MKNKEPVRVKIIRRFYGINGDYDEYKEKEVNKIGNNAFMGFFGYFIVSSLLAALFAVNHPIETLWTYLGCNFFVTIYIIMPYIMFSCEKKQLNTVDVESKNIKPTNKKLIRVGIYSGIYFAIGIHLLDGLIDSAIDNTNFFAYLINLKHITGSILRGLLFGSSIYLVSRLRIRKN